MGISSSFTVVFSIRGQQEPHFCLPHLHPAHSRALTQEVGVTSGAPLTRRAKGTCSRPGCLSFLPSLLTGAQFKRPQWPQQQSIRRPAGPAISPTFTKTNLSSGMRLRSSHKAEQTRQILKTERGHTLKQSNGLVQHPRDFLLKKRDNQLSGRLKRLSGMMTAPISVEKGRGRGDLDSD